MVSFAVSADFPDRLLAGLKHEYRLFGPVKGEDGIVRLRPVTDWSELAGGLPLLPPKKFLLPPRQEFWRLDASGYREPEPPGPTALVGIPPCDLYGLDYLDQVFAEDPLYQDRRRGLLLVGRECRPGPTCFCPPRPEPPPFDLFLAGDRVWAGSERGAAVLAGWAADLGAGEEAPLPASVSAGQQALPENLEALFAASGDWPGWERTGRRCLSCGACSAVCPTCYCYDVVDEAAADGTVARARQWDNCFFRRHGLVAGGHNFRPTRAERLRFRFEHKLLGFGPLRGVSSCVGCGRCGRACPVEIDIAEVLAELAPGGER